MTLVTSLLKDALNLSAEERAVMNTHTTEGARIILETASSEPQEGAGADTTVRADIQTASVRVIE